MLLSPLSFFVLLCVGLVSSHIWFPEGEHGKERGLLSPSCYVNDDGLEVDYSPKLKDTSTTLQTNTYMDMSTDAWYSSAGFNSYHLHVLFAAGNTLQVAAKTNFVSLFQSVAGASSTCTGTIYYSETTRYW